MRFAYATGSRPLDGFTVKRGVGVGGFGEVYFAVSDAGKEVALKCIRRNLDVELRGVSQCLNFKHQHLVAIYDIRYDDEGQAWVVMEYVRGETLKDVIERNPNGMPHTETLNWFNGIAAGVAYLHDHGIVHRDLKPGNVFLDESVVKLGDYGLSKYISCSRRSGQTESVGTFHYMAPEIGRGVYGKEIDVYALGIILYEMLTGQVPFEGETSHEIIMKHLTATPDVAILPEPLRPVVQRALFKDPEQRFHSAAEMVVAVDNALAGGLANASPASSDAVEHHRAAAAHRPQQSPRPQAIYIGNEANDELGTAGMYFGPVRQLAPEAELNRPRERAVVPEEPLARVVRRSWRQFTQWWYSDQLNRTARIVLMVAFGLLFAINVGWIAPMAMVACCGYLVYFGVRQVVYSLRDPIPVTQPRPSPYPLAANALHRPPTPPVAPTAPRPRFVPVALSPEAAVAQAVADPSPALNSKPQSAKRRRWHEVACEKLRHKSAGERVMELTGSMLMSTVVVAVASLLMLVVAGFPMDGTVSAWTQFAWMALTSLLATWTVLLPAKMWEGVEEDAVRRRFAQLILGLGVGAASFALQAYLDPNLSNVRIIDTSPAWTPSPKLFAPDGTASFPAYLVYFAGLFLWLRWWRQADPMRGSRVNLWSVAVVGLVALVWQIFWPFPQPWGLMVPVTISIALQLSAPWISSSVRGDYRKLAEA